MDANVADGKRTADDAGLGRKYSETMLRSQASPQKKQKNTRKEPRYPKASPRTTDLINLNDMKHSLDFLFTGRKAGLPR